jgi:hypothetical protein
MMNKLRKVYRDFFGLREQSDSNSKLPTDSKQLAAYNQELKKTADIMNSMTEADLDEAQLVNNLTDYQGGIEYVLRDPATAQQTAQEIQEWAERKGFTVIKKSISSSGKVGYFYFRLGQDPGRESQRIQGSIAQKPEIKHFRFNVRGDKKIAQRTTPPAPENI